MRKQSLEHNDFLKLKLYAKSLPYSYIKEKVKINVQGHTLFWKHTISKLMIEEYIKSNTDTLFICLYKPIHNWICSMKKASYNIKYNKHNSKLLFFFYRIDGRLNSAKQVV